MQRLYKRGKTYWTSFKVRDGEGWRWVRRSTGQRDKRAAEQIAGQLERAAAAPADAAADAPSGGDLNCNGVGR